MYKKVIFLPFILFPSILAQSVYEPIYSHDIYSFLENLANKDVIDLFTDTRPITRQQIAEKLIQIERQSDLLTSVEKGRLVFFKEEYAFELMYLE